MTTFVTRCKVADQLQILFMKSAVVIINNMTFYKCHVNDILSGLKPWVSDRCTGAPISLRRAPSGHASRRSYSVLDLSLYGYATTTFQVVFGRSSAASHAEIL